MINIDALGKQCPIPLIMTKNSIAKNGNGEYRILVDNEIALQNFEKMAKQYNFTYKYKKHNNNYAITLGVEDASVVSLHEFNEQETSNTIVVFKSQYMGHGDEKLGTVLAKGCVYAFSQLDNPPKTIIFYNSGVKLLCEENEFVKDLKALQNKGVKIFACGTCLDYYQLKNKLLIGDITNMYDIVDMLNSSNKIIIP